MRLIDADALIDKLGISMSCDACVYNCTPFCGWKPNPVSICEEIAEAPTINPERKKMSNKEWVDFLSDQFRISRTSARNMLHGMLKWKEWDNFKSQYSGGR